MYKHFIILVLASVLLSSCCHTLFPVESLVQNYHAQMRTEKDLEIKSKVQIYFNAKDIKSDYTVIASNSYKPFSILPLKFFQDKKQRKKFLAAAVKKAHEQGGNAILVRAAGTISYYYVLNLTDWNADDVPAALFANPIFNMDKANVIKSGALASMKRNERVRTENAFKDEIDADLQNIRALDEITAVREKLQILSDYNFTLKILRKDIEKFVKKGTKICNMKAKKLLRKASEAEVAKYNASESTKVQEEKSGAVIVNPENHTDVSMTESDSIKQDKAQQKTEKLQQKEQESEKEQVRLQKIEEKKVASNAPSKYIVQIEKMHNIIVENRANGGIVYNRYLKLYKDYVLDAETDQTLMNIQKIVMIYINTQQPETLAKALETAHTSDEVLAIFQNYFQKYIK